MFIKSLTIKGFKSFADKLKLQFEPGMIAIVGPNGSGKSNIVDAMLWVLGEQSARLLRGSSMEDVIFAGSSIHKALGMAEVTLVFDNSDGKLPIDYSEISIARRLFRSGESQYLLNGRQVKLNEIKELLSDAALGKGLYSIISQGRIDEILSSKPEDRRLFVDEAAGVLKHRLRREKTQRKLKQLDEKVLRLNDIYSEIIRQIKPLEKQADDARRYSEVKDNLGKLETELAARKIIKLKSKWDSAIEGENRLIGQKNELSKQVEGLSKGFADISVSIQAARKEQQDIFDSREKALIRNEHFNSLNERILQAMAMLDHKIEMTRSSLHELNAQDEQYELFDETYLKNLENEARALKEFIAQKESALLEQKEILRSLDTRQAGIQNEIIKYTAELQEAMLATRSLNVASIEERMAEAELSKVALESEIDQANNELLELNKTHEKASASYRELGDKKDRLQNSIDRTASEKARLDSRISEISNKLTAIRSELQTLDTIYKKKIKDLPQSHSESLAIDLVKFPDEYEDHVLSIFEQEIEGLLVQNENNLTGIMETGYAVTLLDLIGNTKRVSEDKLTCLADKSRGKNAAFLGNIYVAESIGIAMACQKKYMGMNLYFIFQDKIFTPYGSIRHIHAKKDSAFLLKKRIGALKNDIEQSTRLLEAGEAERATVTANVSNFQEELSKLRSSLDNEKMRLQDCETRKSATGTYLQKAVDSKTQLNLRLEQLSRDKQAALADASGLQKLIDGNNDKINESQTELALIKEEINGKAHSLEVLTREHSDLKLQEASSNKEIEQLKGNLIRSQQILDNKKRKMIELTARQSDLIAKKKHLEALSALAAGTLKCAQREMQSALAQRNEKIDELEGMEARQSELQKEIDNEKEKIHSVESAINDFSIKKAEIKVKLTDLKAKMEEELEVDIDQAISSVTSGQTTSEIENEVRKLRMAMVQMGPVNLIAVDELAALKEREELYKTQIDDLVESKRSLSQVIRELDFLIISTFNDFFEKLSENFQIMIESFFPGGSGKLNLTDVDDVLNCGIDIEIRPSAGKKFQTLTLLSGGERAMSALAFMFSLLLTRPSPFCIMDEVDAALDDFNINKLVKFLVNMKTDSQIILITHQKRTMEAADIIFGVSMEPDGTSKVLSRKIEVTA